MQSRASYARLFADHAAITRLGFGSVSMAHGEIYITEEVSVGWGGGDREGR